MKSGRVGFLLFKTQMYPLPKQYFFLSLSSFLFLDLLSLQSFLYLTIFFFYCTYLEKSETKNQQQISEASFSQRHLAWINCRHLDHFPFPHRFMLCTYFHILGTIYISSVLFLSLSHHCLLTTPHSIQYLIQNISNKTHKQVEFPSQKTCHC